MVEACALLPDLDILPAGDSTEIGEKVLKNTPEILLALVLFVMWKSRVCSARQGSVSVVAAGHKRPRRCFLESRKFTRLLSSCSLSPSLSPAPFRRAL